MLKSCESPGIQPELMKTLKAVSNERLLEVKGGKSVSGVDTLL